MSAVEVYQPGEEPSRPAGTAVTPLDMLNSAVARGTDITVIERLMGLHERWEAAQARKAFDNAIANAKGEIGPIAKNAGVDFTTSKGRTNYRYEDFAQVARTVDPILHKHGLTYRFRAVQEGARLRVSCVISHRDGYSEETSLEASEDHSGNKNAIQAIGSAATYLQRYTLKLALGLAAAQDDDGRASSPTTAEPDVITDDQAIELRELIETVDADEAKFCTFLGLKTRVISSLPSARFEKAKAELIAFGRKNGSIRDDQ